MECKVEGDERRRARTELKEKVEVSLRIVIFWLECKVEGEERRRARTELKEKVEVSLQFDNIMDVV